MKLTERERDVYYDLGITIACYHITICYWLTQNTRTRIDIISY